LGCAPLHGELTSSSGLRSPVERRQVHASNGGAAQGRDGEPSAQPRARDIAAMDLFVFQLSVSTCSMPASLSGRPQRPSMGINVKKSTAEWVARQIRRAFPWDEGSATSFPIATGSMEASFTADWRHRNTDKTTAPASPLAEWLVDRLIGSRACNVWRHHGLGEMHLRRVLKSTPTIINKR